LSWRCRPCGGLISLPLWGCWPRMLTGPGTHRALHQGARRDPQPRGRASGRARVGGRHLARPRLGPAATPRRDQSIRDSFQSSPLFDSTHSPWRVHRLQLKLPSDTDRNLSDLPSESI
jgi:hypothetical protein